LGQHLENKTFEEISRQLKDQQNEITTSINRTIASSEASIVLLIKKEVLGIKKLLRDPLNSTGWWKPNVDHALNILLENTKWPSKLQLIEAIENCLDLEETGLTAEEFFNMVQSQVEKNKSAMLF
jgi:hypothetical protein